MNAITDWAMINLNNYGAPALFLLTFAGSLGIPFPITLVIMAAGAVARAGGLDWRLALVACLVGAALADNSEYLLGRWADRWLERRFGQKLGWQRAFNNIERQGWWAILLTRFWFTPLAPAVNMLAGSRYPYARFLLLDLTGELLWVLVYGGLGYLFVDQWMLLSRTVSGFSALSVGLALAAAAVYFVVQHRKKKVRLMQPSPEEKQ